MMIKLFIVYTTLVYIVLSISPGCTPAENDADSSFAFKREVQSIYQLAITKISAVRSKFATSGDTLRLTIDLRLLKRDSSPNNMLMTIRGLQFSPVPFKA